MLKWLDVNGLQVTGEGNQAKALEEERLEKVSERVTPVRLTTRTNPSSYPNANPNSPGAAVLR